MDVPGLDNLSFACKSISKYQFLVFTAFTVAGRKFFWRMTSRLSPRVLLQQRTNGLGLWVTFEVS